MEDLDLEKELDIDKIDLYAKDHYEPKYQLLINEKDFSEYLNDMDDIYKNIEKLNPNKKRNTNCI